MMKQEQQNIIIYQAEDGTVSVNVKLSEDTLWLSLNQMADLFERDKSVISRHLKNIFAEGELEENATVANYATVQIEGDRPVSREVDYYNLDAIISVGYRVNSKRGTQFRRWASQILKDYLVQGYTLNQKRMSDNSINQLQNTLKILSQTLVQQGLVNDLGIQVLEIIHRYTKTWDTLLRYDEDRLENPITKEQGSLIDFNYAEAKEGIIKLSEELLAKGEATSLFGQERESGLETILGNLMQTFDQQPMYPNHALRAAHLLYFVIKDHPFSDGNKRIGCLLFLMYLNKAKFDISHINNNALIALALLIAESHPNQKTLMVQLIMTLLKEKNANDDT